MSYTLLCQIWFVLMGVLLGGYAVLDGFDLGVGILYPFVTRNDAERRAVLNTIGPIWDGNEVWLVTFGGAMFAMFPLAYKSIFSGFYTAFMLLLFMLILRAVSMEFRSKMQHASWRTFWDWCFFVGSTGATLLFGVAVGNCAAGRVCRSGRRHPGRNLHAIASVLPAGRFAGNCDVRHARLDLPAPQDHRRIATPDRGNRLAMLSRIHCALRGSDDLLAV